MYNSLAQTVLRLAAPGVAELYQGAELWELNLVDPDNRRPVDFSRRQAMLVELQRQIDEATAISGRWPNVARRAPDGRDQALRRASRARLSSRARAALLARRLHSARGQWSRWNHVCSFARAHEAEEIIAAVPRLMARLSEDKVPVGPGVWGEDAVVLRAGNGRSSLPKRVHRRNRGDDRAGRAPHSAAGRGVLQHSGGDARACGGCVKAQHAGTRACSGRDKRLCSCARSFTTRQNRGS